MGAATVLSGNLRSITTIGVSITPTEVATITSAEQDFTVPGVKAGDVVLSVQPPSHTAGVTIGAARVKSADTVAIAFVNPTAGGVTPPSGVYKFNIARPEGQSYHPKMTD